MSSVAIQTNLSNCIDALLAGDREALMQIANETISQAEDASELIGRVGLIAMRGATDEHVVLTLSAAAMLCRRLIALRYVLGEDAQGQAKGLPLVVQSLLAAAPAVRAGQNALQNYPQPLFPSDLPDDEPVSAALLKAIKGGDTLTIERLLFGLYGTGADYRTICVRLYDGLSQTCQAEGHPLLYAVRGGQILDTVEWGEDAPTYLHWLAPHLALHGQQPDWTEAVQGFLSEPQHSLASYRTRIAAPQNAHALPLLSLILGDASVPQICQGVYDALIKNGASARAIGSVIALAASNMVQECGEEERDLFREAAHGLLYASATRLIYTQVQEVEALPQLFTAAVYVNELHKKLSGQTLANRPTLHPRTGGGGLIAPALLESLHASIAEHDEAAALVTARRYLQLGHDAVALFGVIGLGATLADAVADQGHTLQIVQAAGDEYLAWPQELGQNNADSFLQVALRAATLAARPQ